MELQAGTGSKRCACSSTRTFVTTAMQGGIRELTEEEQTNPELFYHNKALDLKHEGMNVKLILAFFATTKTKPNGTSSSFSHICKYHDAILYGAKKS